MKQISITLAIWLAFSSQCLAQLGSFAGAYLGPAQYQVGVLQANAPTTQTFTAANTGWCARVLATDTRDFKSVAVNFSAATTPGTATIRIETIDTSTGKPSGTLYDAAATKSFTPAVGWNVVTFDSLPTAGLTAGTIYAIVMLKDDAGTTCTLRSHVSGGQGALPLVPMQAADGTTRSNFTETSQVSSPIAYFVMEDDNFETLGCVPSVGGGATALDSADDCIAQKITLPVDVVIRGVRFIATTGIVRGGTPTVDLRMRILDSTNTAVSGTTVTIDKDVLISTNGRGLHIPLPPTELAAGTYRIAFDSAGAGANYFGLVYITVANAAFQSSGFCYSFSSNMTSTFTWTDSPTQMLGFGLELDSIPEPEVVDPDGGTDQVTITPFYSGDIQENTGSHVFDFVMAFNGVPTELSGGVIQARINGGSAFTSGLTLATIAPGNYKVTVDSDNAVFDGGGNISFTLSAGTVDGISQINAKVGEISMSRYAAAPAGFNTLSIEDESVKIQDGTDPGQIATTSGAIDTVTTVTQLTAATTEPTSVPSATAGFIDKVNWLFLIARNKKNVTDAIIQYFADDGSTVVGEKDLTDNGTTFTEAEATDP